jgi:tRNA 2-thiocytidine biosynthesis protein TtcA
MSVLSKPVNRKIGRAMHDYSMLADGDQVLIAVSGGVDSLVLSWILNNWQHKAPIRYNLLAVYIDNGFGTSMSDNVAKQLDRINVPYLIEKTDF